IPANGFSVIPAGGIVWARFNTQTIAGVTSLNPSTRFDLALTSQSQRWIAHPISNHNGGTLNISANDGVLYARVADGGGAGETPHTAQNANPPLGKMLRVDPNVDDANLDGFATPPSTPFVPASNPPITALQQIWSFGMRNPWKHSFDDYGHGRL